jgi:hypothetical protein
MPSTDPWQPKIYLSYLLRVWQAAEDEQTIWRASLEEVESGRRQQFANLPALADYLMLVTTGLECEGADQRPGQPPGSHHT